MRLIRGLMLGLILVTSTSSHARSLGEIFRRNFLPFAAGYFLIQAGNALPSYPVSYPYPYPSPSPWPYPGEPCGITGNCYPYPSPYPPTPYPGGSVGRFPPSGGPNYLGGYGGGFGGGYGGGFGGGYPMDPYMGMGGMPYGAPTMGPMMPYGYGSQGSPFMGPHF
jgi:spore coat protein T